ncbi:MAG: glycosyltransferase family 2 protein [Methylococcaceae bacterium]
MNLQNYEFKEKDILLSIITTVLNGDRFIEDCIQNVIEQGFAHIEHIIIDGGSTDKTVDIIKSYAEKYAHIRWISEKDKGQSNAMNKGIQMAAGSILGFLNVDDYYEPGALCEAFDLIKNLPEPSLLVGNCKVWDKEHKLWFVSMPKMINLRNLLLERYAESFPVNPSAYFYHKSLHQCIGMYEEDEHYGMDLHFIFKSVQKANVIYIDRIWGNYRYFEGTKTYEDNKSGCNLIRVKGINQFYLKQQPLHYRLYLVFIKAWGQVIKRIHNVIKGCHNFIMYLII